MSLSRIHDDLIHDILPRLPVKDLLRFRGISKSLCTLIDGPAFIPDAVHLIKLPVKDVLRFRCISKSLCAMTDSRAFATPHLNRSHEAKTATRKLVFVGTSSMDETLGHDDDDAILLGSCNSLLLLHNVEDTILWNPFTNKSKSVPRHDDGKYKGSCIGLGYDSTTNDYKVVIIRNCTSPRRCQIRVSVFHVATNYSSEVAKVPFQNRDLNKISLTKVGVFANGALHWLWHPDKTPIVLSFDVSKQVFVQMLLPIPKSACSSPHLSLQVLDGRLFLVESVAAFWGGVAMPLEKRQIEHDALVLYEAVDVGKGFAWIKLYKISVMILRLSSLWSFEFDDIKVLELSKDGTKTLLQLSTRDEGGRYRYNLYWYDLQRGSYEAIHILGNGTLRSPFPYYTSFCLESLVSF